MADFEIERPSVDVQPIQPTYNINTPSFTIEINGSTPGQRGEQGPPGQDGRDGIDGQDGRDGIDGINGVGVASIEQTSTSHESGGTNIITATLTDGSQSFFEIMNGEAGADSGIVLLNDTMDIEDLVALDTGFYRVPVGGEIMGTVIDNGGLFAITHRIDDGFDIATFYILEDSTTYNLDYSLSPDYPNIEDYDGKTRFWFGEVSDDLGDGRLSGPFNIILSKDVINNLTTNDSSRPLSAAQGKALKDLLDAIATTIPTVNDATLTIQRNGSNLGTFTANASVNKSINITVPTKTSDITNDSNFVTSTNVGNTIKATGYSTKTDPVLGTIEVVNYTKRYGGTNYAYLSSKTVAHTVGNNTDTLDNVIDSKQETLVSGTNIKTINNQSILGPGNIDVSGGGSTPTDVRVNGTSITSNDVADIQVDGTYDSSNNKIATMSSLPTKVSDLSNDTGFITNTVNNLTNYYTKTNTYTKSEVDSLISAVSTMDIQVVQTLPTQDISTTTIYLVPKTASTNDAYDEYIYVNNNWEHIGSTEVDLSNYYTKTETDDLLDDKADLTDIQNDKSIARGVEYIIGTQTAATNLWTGVSTDTGCSNNSLYTGKVIIYHLPQAGSSSAATLNLTLPDGTTTGAKSVYRLASTTTTTNFAAGCDILMVYDGAHWKVNAYVDTSGSNTIGYQLRTNSAIFKNKTGYSMNRYTLLFEVDGGLSGAATTIATGTTKTTVPFKYIPGGVIKYYATSGSIANNANFTATGLWDQYTLNLGYTFNTGSTLTSGKPVYMRCVVNSDGTLTPNYAGSPSHPIVQDLPTTEDGYVYVYLGQAYNTTNIELMYMHPIYEYKNGKIREYVDAAGGTVTETDPVFTASAAYGITSSDITNWNNKSITDLSSTVILNDINSGIYRLAKGTVLKYKESDDDSNPTTLTTVNKSALMMFNIKVDSGYPLFSYIILQDDHDGTYNTAEEHYQLDVDSNSHIMSGCLSPYTGDGWNEKDLYINNILDWNDVINNLTSNITYKPLSAKQGKVLKDAIDAITIPTVNDSTITIQKNGTNVDSFTTNASSNKSINITVPTTTNDLTNNSGFITNSVNNLTNYTLTSSLATVATSGSYNDLSNKPTIPTITLSTTTWIDQMF